MNIAFDPKKLGARATVGTALRTGDRALILSLEGKGKTGKSDLAYRAPLPLVVQCLDMGEDRPLERLMGLWPERFDRTFFYSYHYSAFKDGGAKDEDIEKHVWEPFKQDFYRSLQAGARSIVWDKATEAWEVIRLANFGKLEGNPQIFYGPVNREFKEMIRAAKDAGVVLVLIHDVKEEYETKMVLSRGQMTERSVPTGRTVRAGNSKIDTLVDAYCENKYIPPVKDRKGEVVEPGKFLVEVLRAGHNASMNGVVVESPDFATLAGLVKPGVDWSEEETA